MDDPTNDEFTRTSESFSQFVRNLTPFKGYDSTEILNMNTDEIVESPLGMINHLFFMDPEENGPFSADLNSSVFELQQ